jgi:hypothetical protein
MPQGPHLKSDEALLRFLSIISPFDRATVLRHHAYAPVAMLVIIDFELLD